MAGACPAIASSRRLMKASFRAPIALTLEDRLEISRVGAEIPFHVFGVLGAARTLDHQPAAPAHFIEGLFHLWKVHLFVVLKPDSVLVCAMDLAYSVLAERAQFAHQIATGFNRVGKVAITADSRW